MSEFNLMDMETLGEDRDVPNADLHLLDIPLGGEFKVNGIEFIRLGFEQGGILCITKESMFTSKFHTGENNNYSDSLVRRKIIQEFLPHMDGVELLPFTMDLRAENGETDYGICTDDAGLITTDLYRKYHYQIPMYNRNMWTCTPFSCMSNFPYVEYVNSSGGVYNGSAHGAGRCRPACIFAI